MSKKRLYYLLAFFPLLLVALPSCGLFPKEYVPGHQFRDKVELQETLRGKEWNFELEGVTGPLVPSGFNSYGFGFDVRGDSIRCYLPFFGRGYSTHIYGTDKGPMTFEGKITSYRVTAGRQKGEVETVLVTRPSGGNNEVTLRVNAFTNGSATVTMTSTDTQSLSYRGKITLPKEDRKKGKH